MSSPPTPAMRFVAELERFQRRALRVMFVRFLFTASAVATIAVAAAVLLMRLSSQLEFVFIATATSAALIGAGVTTFFRRPGLRATAVSIDARCQLDDCLAAAVQFSGDADPVSRLIVEQGHARLNRVTPADVFPYEWEWARYSTGLSAAAVVAVLVVVASHSIGVPHWSGFPITGGGSVAPVSESPAGATGHAVGSRARPDADRGTDAAGAGQFPPTSNAHPESTPPTAVGGLATTDRDRPSSPRPDEVRAQQPDLAPAGPASATDAAVASRANRPGDRLTARATAADTAGGSGPASGGAAKESRGQAGGVEAGQLVKRAETVPTPKKLPANYGARYRDAAGRAEEALAREQVPAELRETVRAYFTAIRP